MGAFAGLEPKKFSVFVRSPVMSFACLLDRREHSFRLPEPVVIVMDGFSPVHPESVEEAERWMLEDRYGKRVPLKKNAMLFLGREECDILLKVRNGRILVDSLSQFLKT